MKFEQLVEVTNVYPGPIGGCVFMGIYQGLKQSIRFRVKHSVIARNPNIGEFWFVRGDSHYYEKYGNVVVVKDATINALPDDSYVVKFLTVHPKFRGFNFGKKGAEKLVEDIGAPELIKLLNKGDWKTISDARINEVQSQRLCCEWLELKNETELATFLV